MTVTSVAMDVAIRKNRPVGQSRSSTAFAQQFVRGNNASDTEINILSSIKGGLIVKLSKTCFDGIRVDSPILANMNLANINTLCTSSMI